MVGRWVVARASALALSLLLVTAVAAPPGQPPARRRGLRWAVSAANAGIDDFLLHDNNVSWANTSLSVTNATLGIDAGFMPSGAALVINRSGHLFESYPCTLNASRFAKWRAAGMFATVDIGPADDSHERSCPDSKLTIAAGLNCSNPPRSDEHSCVTPGDLCRAALARKEDFSAELLDYLLRHDLSGITVDWENPYGNDMPCFRELWMHVKAVIGPHGKSFSPWVSNGGAYTPNKGNDDYEWNYTAYLPFADRLLNMASYWVTGHGEAPLGYNYSRSGNYGYNRSITPVPCHDHAGRWCGLEGTIVDMLEFGATVSQVVPAVWMARCFPNGTMTLTGWTQPKLREFLAFAGMKGCERASDISATEQHLSLGCVLLCCCAVVLMTCMLCRVQGGAGRGMDRRSHVAGTMGSKWRQS
eukprot:COSAG02_NODE_6437_length_3569_cov_1.906916_4_plen_416_part_00